MKRVQVRIVTSDVARLRRFYQEVIGLSPTGDDRYVEFHGPQTTLAIASQRLVEIHAPGATVPASNRSVVFDFEVDDVDEEYKRLQGISGEFVLKPTDQPWGNRSMLFRDPDGNLINFFAPIRAAAGA